MHGAEFKTAVIAACASAGTPLKASKGWGAE